MNNAREKTYRLFDCHELVHELLHVLVIVPSQNLFYKQSLVGLCDVLSCVEPLFYSKPGWENGCFDLMQQLLHSLFAALMLLVHGAWRVSEGANVMTSRRHAAISDQTLFFG